MSSKNKNTATNKDTKPKVVPKLRFPEFRSAAVWENKLIGPYLEDCSGRVPPNTELPIYSSTREGLKRQDAYFDGKVLQNKNEYGVVPPGCFVYRHMSDDGLFKFNINETGGEIAVSKEYPVFNTKGLVPAFLLAKLNDGLDFKHFALSQKAGGTRTRLYFSRLCEWRTLLPSPAEQQKIAECLSSVDELIAAQARKADALKTHKKGLMQQLFPREGETQPRLRFRFRFHEFPGEWKETTLGELCLSISSGRDTRESDGQFDLYGSTGVIGKTATASYHTPHILIARVGANAGHLTKASGHFGVTDNTLVINLKPVATVDYIFHYLGNINLNRLIFGSGQPLITGSILKAQRVLIPSATEQNKVSTILSSLDDLISAECERIEALKNHKKGLLQQLFPPGEGLIG